MPQARTRHNDTAGSAHTRLLLAVLAQVPFEGWTDKALRLGARAAGLSETTAQKIFPDVAAVVAAQHSWANEQMLLRIAGEKLYERMRVRDKVAYAVRVRLEALTPHREAQRRLALWYALPQHAPQAVRHLAALCDTIWKAAGDTSTDHNFYTKRMLLAYVVKSTTLFWLNDDSPGATASWSFLDRRVAEVLQLGKLAQGMGRLPEALEKLGKASLWAARWRGTPHKG